MKEAIEQIFKELEELKASSAKEVEEARIRFKLPPSWTNSARWRRSSNASMASA